MQHIVIAVLCVFCALLASLYGVSIVERADQQDATREYFARYRAARWLACYNHASVAVLQDLLAKRAGLSYRAIRELVNAQLAKQPYYGALNQLMPMQLVPEDLCNDAETYNIAVTRHGWPSGYTAKGRCVETPDQLRARQLGDALDVLTRAPTEERLDSVAAATGVPLPHVREVAQAMRSRAEWDLLQILGTESNKPVTVEPETVLPSIY